MLVCEETAGRPNTSHSNDRPIHTYNNGQPHQIARGRRADRRDVELHRSTTVAIDTCRPARSNAGSPLPAI